MTRVWLVEVAKALVRVKFTVATPEKLALGVKVTR